MPAPLRRSRRSRVANPKYLNNDWDDKTLSFLEDSNSEVDTDDKVPSQVASDDDFTENNQGAASEDERSVNVTSGNSSNVEDANRSDTDMSIDVNNNSRTPAKAAKKTRSSIGRLPTLHTRGLPNIDRKAGKSSVFHDTFGPDAKDSKAVLKAQDRWHLSARDATLPSRHTLLEALRNEWAKDASGEKTRTASTNSSQQKRQKLTSSCLADLRADLFIPSSQAQRVVLGPQQNETFHEIDHLESLDFGKAWEETTRAGNSSNVSQNGNRSDPSSNPGSGQSSRRFHEGWLINTGEKVNSLAWYQGRNAQRDTQYLAVACRSNKAQRDKVVEDEQKRSRAFSPSVKYPSYIQVWRVPCRNLGSGGTQTLAFDSKAEISHVVATEIGDIMQVAWLPSSDSQNYHDQDLGALAVLSTDGCFRVIDIPLSSSEPASPPVSLKMKEPALCIEPVNGAVFSAFTFASSSDLIIGASNGEVSLYNLDACWGGDTCSPYMVLSLHHTYIMGLATAGHDELSHFLCSTSAAGDLRLTDLRTPQQDSVLVPRSRLPTRNLVYCPLTQSFITTIDHSGRTEVQATRTTISAYQLRHFYSQVMLSKFPNNTGTASALTASSLHPYILVGNTQGTVQCQNIFKKLLPKAGGWVQKLCEYDWIPEPKHHPANNSTDDPGVTTDSAIEHNTSALYHGHDARSGISRFREGFTLEKQDLASSLAKPPKGAAKGKNKRRRASSQDIVDDNDDNDDDDDDDTGKATTRRPTGPSGEAVGEVIFEEENAVTAMCWNEDPKCAAWVAIGWGSGIVRIQDLSHDTR